jgi:hypothetical protein
MTRVRSGEAIAGRGATFCKEKTSNVTVKTDKMAIDEKIVVRLHIFTGCLA